jgi:hypothetical protein
VALAEGVMKTIDVLRKARELISDPARWTQGQPACALTPEQLTARSQWLAYGSAAIRLVKRGKGPMMARDGRQADRAEVIAILSRLPKRVPATQEETLRAFDRAIAAAERS